MKPKDFRVPFNDAEQRVVIHDRVLVLPKNCKEWESFSFPGWSELFGNDHSVHVEYCSGNGSWIAEKAAHYPKINWVAVEQRSDRVAKVWSKMRNRELSNLFVVWGEAYRATELYFPDDTVSAIYINFPDPWPKRRHHKNRLLKSPFIREMVRTLIGEGTITFVTDDVDYSHYAIEQLLQESALRSLYGEPHFVESVSEDYGSSYFERLWREKGRAIRYHRFSKLPVARV